MIYVSLCLSWKKSLRLWHQVQIHHFKMGKPLQQQEEEKVEGRSTLWAAWCGANCLAMTGGRGSSSATPRTQSVAEETSLTSQE